MFKEKVLEIVRKIPKGNFLKYKEVARLAGNEKAYRVVASILARNKDPNIPCHRVIRNDNLVGGYLGKKTLDWLKAGILLKEGAIGVIPTDTIYGICTSAFNKKSVEKVYKLRKRNPNKPCIILIHNFDDLRKFNIRLEKWQRKILEKIWPSKISVILPIRIIQPNTYISHKCSSSGNNHSNIPISRSVNNLYYLHRGTNSLAFRLPKNKLILNILKISGPLIAPSANFEGYEPAKNIREAKKYFGDKVFYLDRGNLISKPSTLIDLREKKIKILREGENIEKIYKIIRNVQ